MRVMSEKERRGDGCLILLCIARKPYLVYVYSRKTCAYVSLENSSGLEILKDILTTLCDIPDIICIARKRERMIV